MIKKQTLLSIIMALAFSLILFLPNVYSMQGTGSGGMGGGMSNGSGNGDMSGGMGQGSGGGDMGSGMGQGSGGGDMGGGMSAKKKPMVMSVNISPKKTIVPAGETAIFTVTVKIKNKASKKVIWSVTGGSANGTIAANDLTSATYTAPAEVTEPRTIKIVAKSKMSKMKKSIAMVTLIPAVSSGDTITISNFAFSPVNLGAVPGAVITVTNEDEFTHTVTSASKPLNYTKGSVKGISFDTGSFINTDGSKTIEIPVTATVGTVIPYFCTEHTNTMTTKNGFITIVNPAEITISVSPENATIESEGTAQFTATITGTLDEVVTWTVDGGDANGTIDTSGLYTAPVLTTTMKSAVVRATSNADPAQSSTASVTLVPTITNGDTITISGLTFSPVNLGVSPGAVITVTNTVGFDHSVTSASEPEVYTNGAVNGISFDTGLFLSSSVTIEIPVTATVGTVIPYYCSQHMSLMTPKNGFITIK
ncbi:MAG: Ig-like domain-containing protein [Candidatus Schekmanbacteria bacterium]|nr:Ig-like domain-containing protein [Candidatus Schekmanbacteria bacterium]